MAILMMKRKTGLPALANSTAWDLPSPSTMTYFWNFGSTLGLCLILQIATGLMLTLHYSSSALDSFTSITHMMREVWGGWALRFIHMNGASVFFFFIYFHLFRGLYYMSAVHKGVWITGTAILATLMAISFLGYVLPWGQMSYWAVAVITNLFSVIPFVGTELVLWIWGGFSVSDPTLTRFYSFHFLLPFVLAFFVIAHLAFLHKGGSSNAVGVDSDMDKIDFHPYYSIKDLVFIVGVLTLSFMLSFYIPYLTGDAVNNVPANSMQTPVHIQPEWYFLPSYAILRSLPSKTAGVLALALSVGVFFILPAYNLTFSTKFGTKRMILFWTIICSFFYLMKLGALPAEQPYVTLGQFGTAAYFLSIFYLNVS